MIFDPGTYGLDDIDHDTLDALAVVSEFFTVEYPGHRGECPVITQGGVLVAHHSTVDGVTDNFVVVDKVIFDSGAMQASYISKE